MKIREHLNTGTRRRHTREQANTPTMDSSCSDFWKLLHGTLCIMRQNSNAQKPFLVSFGFRHGTFLEVGMYGVYVEKNVLKTPRFSALREHFSIFQLRRGGIPCLYPAGTSAVGAMFTSDLESFQAGITATSSVCFWDSTSASHVLAILTPIKRLMRMQQHVGRQLLLARSAGFDCSFQF